MEPAKVDAAAGGSWLDRLISYFAPKWSAERAMYRAAEQQLSASYRGARFTRVGRDKPTGGRADYHLEATYDRRDLVDRARQLERSNVIAEGLLSRSVENVVGCGFRLQAQSNNPKWNQRAELAWRDYCEFEADVRGLSTMDELLGLTYRSWLRDGDVGTILLSDGKLQTIESDQIAHPLGSIPTVNHVDGIELDDRGRPTKFLVVTNPDPILSSVRHGNSYTEIDAKNMLFMARRQRIGQTRGLSAFSGVAWVLDQLDGNLEAITVGNRMAACVGLVISRKGRMSGLGETTGANGSTYRKLTLEPGMIQELGEGDEVTTVNPSRQLADFPEFMRLLARMVGLSFGMPLEVAFMDFSQSNYSSARGALLQAHKVWRGHQDMLKRHMSRIYRWWLVRSMEDGTLPVRSDALQHTWITPGWKWVDPQKELQANLAAVDAGIMTLSELAMQQGSDWDELVQARARELQTMRENGLPEVRSTMTRDPVQQMPGAQDPPSADERRAEEEEAHVRALERLRAATPQPAQPNFNVHVMQDPPSVRVEPAQIHVEPPQVNFMAPEQLPPTVNVEAPSVTVNNQVETPEVHVTNEVPTPSVTVENTVEVEQGGKSLRVKRDADGKIVGVEAE